MKSRAAGNLTPRHVSRAGLKIMEIMKLLPMTNCKARGYATCMAHAAALREREISLNDYPPLWEEKYRLNQNNCYWEID